MRAALLALAAAAALLSVPARADGAPSAAEAASTPALSEGEVRKVDREAGKVTLRHGPLRNLDMPAMTMVFTATDPALLDGLKPGDRVRFVAAHEGGKYLVTALQRAE